MRNEDTRLHLQLACCESLCLDKILGKTSAMEV